MFSFTPNAFGHAFSWFSRLRSRSHPHSSTTVPASEKIPRDTIVNVVLAPLYHQLSLDLPSPSIHLSFAGDSSFSLDTDHVSQLWSAESSLCSTPSFRSYSNINGSCKSVRCSAVSSPVHPSPLRIVTNLLPNEIAVDTAIPQKFNRNALLAEYSHQELVLLEFLTREPNVQIGDIDEVLLQYPPGFSSACQCVNANEDDTNLCEVCQLVDAYMDYSFKKFRGVKFAT
ncbi:hypothetical protein K439DRAFT_1633665 [Ramaria rubella]|nr:hypothetical protein K439DRAFT_1633665 [Ramaria rubella]